MKLEKLRFLIKISIQFIKKDKIRSLLTLCTVTICVFLINALTTNMTTNAYYDYDTSIKMTGDWLLYYSSDSYDIENQIEDITDIKETTVTSTIGYSDVDEYYHVELISYSNFDLLPMYLYDGDYPQNENEVLITRAYNNKTGFKTGDTITMEVTDPADPEKKYDKTVKVSGIIQGVAASSDTGDFYDRIITRSSKKADYYTVYVKTDTISNDQLSKLQILIENTDNAGLNHDEAIIKVYTGHLPYSFSNIAKTDIIIFIVLFILMYVTLKNIFSMSFKKRQRNFGILSSVGASFNDLKLLAIIEAILYAIPGLLIGIFSSNFIMKTLRDNLVAYSLESEYNSFPVAFVSIPLVTIIVALVITIVLSLAGLSALKGIKKISIIDLFKTAKYQKNSFSKKRKTVLKSCKNTSLALATTYMKMDKKKYLSVLITLIFSIVFLNVTNYNANINEQYLQETMDMNALYVDCSIYDFYQNRDDFNKLIETVKEKQPQNKTSVSADFDFENINNLPFDQYSDEYLSSFTTPETNNVTMRFIGVDEKVLKEVTGQSEPILLNKKIITEGTRNSRDIPIFNDGTITITMSYDYLIEDEMNWIQEKLDFTAKIDGMYDLDDFGITDVYESALQDSERLCIYMLAPYDYYLSRYQEMEFSNANSIDILFKIDTDNRSSLKKEILSDEFISKYLVSTEKNQPDQYLTLTSKTTKMIAYLALVVCIINLAIIIISNSYERENDYAILESLGIDDRDMKKMIFFENLSLVIIAIIISTPLIIGIEGLLYYYQYTYIKEFKISYITIILMALISLLIAVLASILLYKLIKNKSIIEKIKGNDI